MSADLRVVGCISIPRLGWNDFWGATYDVLSHFGIPLLRGTGAYWEQSLSKMLESALEESPTHILTLDYDSVFSVENMATLLKLAADHPQADAIAALQVSRGGHNARPLFAVGAEAQDAIDGDADLVPAMTAHFGCTLIRADALASLPRPWLWSQPNDCGQWRSGKMDADIRFWRSWRECGKSLYIAPRVPIGHLEVMIRWPNRHLEPTWQHPSDLKQSGPPPDIWQ